MTSSQLIRTEKGVFNMSQIAAIMQNPAYATEKYIMVLNSGVAVEISKENHDSLIEKLPTLN